MNTVSSATESQPRRLPQWQEKTMRKLTFAFIGIALLILVIGTLVDRWLPTPGRNAAGVVVGFFMLIAVAVRHSYLRGVADAAADSERQS